jgi:hypothetical protein
MYILSAIEKKGYTYSVFISLQRAVIQSRDISSCQMYPNPKARLDQYICTMGTAFAAFVLPPLTFWRRHIYLHIQSWGAALPSQAIAVSHQEELAAYKPALGHKV